VRSRRHWRRRTQPLSIGERPPCTFPPLSPPPLHFHPLPQDLSFFPNPPHPLPPLNPPSTLLLVPPSILSTLPPSPSLDTSTPVPPPLPPPQPLSLIFSPACAVSRALRSAGTSLLTTWHGCQSIDRSVCIARRAGASAGICRRIAKPTLPDERRQKTSAPPIDENPAGSHDGAGLARRAPAPLGHAALRPSGHTFPSCARNQSKLPALPRVNERARPGT